ncbi:MAG: hypothetical protein ACREGI_01455 [Candidatus Levyibacteriota bacterium]
MREATQAVAQLYKENKEFTASQPGYTAIEATIGNTLAAHFGNVFRRGQQIYLQQPQCLVFTRQQAREFGERWKAYVAPQTVLSDVASLNDMLYTGYVPESSFEEHASGGHREWMAGEMLFGGKIPVYVLPEEFVGVRVGTNALDVITHTSNAATGSLSSSFPSAMAAEMQNALREARASFDFLRVATHEKIHGVQDPNLPLPIREACSAWFEREVSRLVCKGYEEKDLAHHTFNEAANVYSELVAHPDMGQDVHRLLFGNLQGERKMEVLDFVKAAFNPQGLAKAFPTVQWQARSV